MRINVHPDYLGEALEQKKRETGRLTGDTSFLVIPREARTHEYSKLLESVYDAVIVTDLKGRIVDFNRRAVDFFLCDGEELFGRKVLDLISGADEDLLKSIGRNLEEHRYTLIEAHCVRRDDSMFPAEIAVNKIDLDQESQLCFFVRDITVRKKAQDALEEAVEKLEEHDRRRSQFVSNVSHELRTPLTSMIYAVANLLRGVAGDLSQGVRRYIELLDGDCRRLLGTVNDILDLRKVEAGSLELAKARIPLKRLVVRTAEALRVQAEQKQQGLSIDPGTRSWFVDCDAHKMERVILNVIGNAVKFTPEDGNIEVSLAEDPSDGGRVVVSVKDSGIGIPAGALPKVTQRYFTVGEQVSGTGLGLAISKEIVELHGGSIGIESPPPGRERGTEVSISLPVAEAPTVLVADDDESVVSLLASQIAGQGYGVMTASDGREALEKLEKESPDVVVLDLVLPEIHGTEIILKMKSDKALMRLPVIAVTGASMDRAKAGILSSFSIPALSKPWDEAELLDRVESALLGSAALSR